jgi:hypothetical protein
MQRSVALTLSLILSLALGCSDRVVKTTPIAPTPNLITIHLAARADATNGVFSIVGQKFFQAPVLSDTDFTSFDPSGQKFAITPAAALRLSKEIDHLHNFDTLSAGFDERLKQIISSGTRFLFKAEGTPIYIGTFHTLTSSFTQPASAFIAEPNFISLNDTNNIGFVRLGAPPYGTPKPIGDPADPRVAAAAAKLMHSRRR